MLLFTTTSLFVVWSSLQVTSTSGSLSPLLPGKNMFDGYNMAPWPKADVPIQPINYMRSGNDYLSNNTGTMYGMPGVDKVRTSEGGTKPYSLELRMDGLTKSEQCDKNGCVKGIMRYIQDGVPQTVKYEAGPAEEMPEAVEPVNQPEINMIHSSPFDINNNQLPNRIVGGMPSSLPAASNPQTNLPDQSRPTGLNSFMQPNELIAQPSMMPINQQMTPDVRQSQHFFLGQTTQNPVNMPNLNQMNPDLNQGGDFSQLRNELILKRVSALMGQPAFDSAINTNDQNRLWRSETQGLPLVDATNSQYPSLTAQSIAALKTISALQNLEHQRSVNPTMLVFLNKISDMNTNDKERSGVVSDANEKEVTKETTDFKSTDIMEALAKTIMTQMAENQRPEVVDKDISSTQST